MVWRCLFVDIFLRSHLIPFLPVSSFDILFLLLYGTRWSLAGFVYSLGDMDVIQDFANSLLGS